MYDFSAEILMHCSYSECFTWRSHQKTIANNSADICISPIRNWYRQKINPDIITKKVILSQKFNSTDVLGSRIKIYTQLFLINVFLLKYLDEIK